MISLLCPSRNRPKRFEMFVKSVRATAKNVEILLCLQTDDLLIKDYDDSLADVVIFHPGGVNLGDYYNELGRIAKGDILFMAADDMTFKTNRWDEMLLSKMPPDGIAAFSFDHCRGGIGHPHPGISRRWYEVTGRVTCSHFKHWGSDKWLSDLGTAIDRLIYVNEIKAPHAKNFDGKTRESGTKHNWGPGKDACIREIEAVELDFQNDIRKLKEAIEKHRLLSEQKVAAS